jgi:hypothetical protein
MSKKKKMLLSAGFIFLFSLFIIGVTYTGSSINQSKSDEHIQAIEASTVYPVLEKDWAVNYRVKKQRIYIENIIPKFSFQGNSVDGMNVQNGYIAVFINGKWTMNANSSIFILKNISHGKHKITLQLKKKDGSDYGIKKNIYVHIH